MKKFKYKLQNVLSVKLRIEEQKKATYATIQSEVNLAEEKLSSLKEEKLFYEDKLRECMNSKLDVPEMKRCSSSIKTMDDLIALQKDLIYTLNIKLDKARMELQKAMIERKTYEKLKEKAFVEFLAEVEAEEKKEIDETVSYNYSKKIE